MVSALANIVSAFGLSTAAGLNAFIPLLAVSLLGRFGVVELAAPFDVITKTWAIAVIAVFLLVELVVDKIPGADHVNDIVQSFVRPAVGALLFAAEAGVIANVHDGIWLALGLLTAFTVHGAKTAARPVVNVSTAGLGAPLVSVVEDAIAVVTTFLAIFLPIVMLVFVITLGVVLARYLDGKKRASQPREAG